MKYILIGIPVAIVLAVLVWLGIREKQREDAERIIDAEKARMKELHKKYPGMVNKESLGIFKDWIDD
jgi:cytochrome c-type biogenesis protein CcmH/NrfF